MSGCREEHEGAGGGEGHDHNHNHGHSHDHDHSHDVEDPDGFSLFGHIDTSRPYDRRRDLEPVVRSNEDDPELLMYIPFTHVVKVKAISVRGGPGGTAPSKMKVWVNRDDIDFANAAELPAVQTNELVNGEGSAVEVDYPAKMSKMQNVSDITIFFPENFGGVQGEEMSTVLSYLGFKGEATSFKGGTVECVYEAKPNHADHKKAGADMPPTIL